MSRHQAKTEKPSDAPPAGMPGLSPVRTIDGWWAQGSLTWPAAHRPQRAGADSAKSGTDLKRAADPMSVGTSSETRRDESAAPTDTKFLPRLGEDVAPTGAFLLTMSKSGALEERNPLY